LFIDARLHTRETSSGLYRTLSPRYSRVQTRAFMRSVAVRTRSARRTPALCCDTHASHGQWQRTNGTAHYNTPMRTGPQAKSGTHVGAGSLHASIPAPHLAGHVPTWLDRSARAASTSALTSLNGSAPDMRAALKTSAVAACRRCPRFRAPSKQQFTDPRTMPAPRTMPIEGRRGTSWPMYHTLST